MPNDMTDVAPERLKISHSLTLGVTFEKTPDLRAFFPATEYIRADIARPMTVAGAAKVLRDAMDGTDIEALTAFIRAADAMIVEQGKGLGPALMLSAALRALSQGGE